MHYPQYITNSKLRVYSKFSPKLQSTLVAQIHTSILLAPAVQFKSSHPFINMYYACHRLNHLHP